MKTNLTKEIEKSIILTSKATGPGVYGCLEVTLGEGYGHERVDYMTMDCKGFFRCYEIKTSKSDFKSKAKKSFVGDFNYFVFDAKTYEQVKTEIDMKYYGVGIYIYNGKECVLVKKPIKKNLHLYDKTKLMYCMVRSLSRYTLNILKEK